MQKEATIRDPLILGKKSYHDITKDVARPVEGKANKYWWILFSLSFVLFLWGVLSIAYTVGTGIGVWGLNKTVNWFKTRDCSDVESVGIINPDLTQIA